MSRASRSLGDTMTTHVSEVGPVELPECMSRCVNCEVDIPLEVIARRFLQTIWIGKTGRWKTGQPRLMRETTALQTRRHTLTNPKLMADDVSIAFADAFGLNVPTAQNVLSLYDGNSERAADAILTHGLDAVLSMISEENAVVKSSSKDEERHKSKVVASPALSTPPAKRRKVTAHSHSASPSASRAITQFFKPHSAPLQKPVLENHLETLPLPTTPVKEAPSSELPKLVDSTMETSSKPSTVSFATICEVFQTVESETSRLKIIEALSSFFRSLIEKNQQDLLPAIYLSVSKIDANFSEAADLGVGPSMIMRALARATGKDNDWMSKKFNELGDPGDVAFFAMGGGGGKRQTLLFRKEALTVTGVFRSLREIATMQGERSVNRKVDALSRLMMQCTSPLEMKFLVRIMSRSIRTGATEITVLVCAALASIPRDLLEQSRHEDAKRKAQASKLKTAQDVQTAVSVEELDGDDEMQEDENSSTEEFELHGEEQSGFSSLHRIVPRVVRVCFMQLPSLDVLAPLLQGTYEFFDTCLRHRDSLTIVPPKFHNIVTELPPSEAGRDVFMLRAWRRWFLRSCDVRCGIPIKPMLATPSTGVEDLLHRFSLVDKDQTDVSAMTCEFKYDGMRAQIHYSRKGTVQIFSRRLENVTARFPEVVSSVTTWFADHGHPVSFVLDVEVIGILTEPSSSSSSNGTTELKFLPFQMLSTRARKPDSAAASGTSAKDVPVAVIAFDLLLLDDRSLLNQSLRERRELLWKTFAPKFPEFVFSTFVDIASQTPKELVLSQVMSFLTDAVKAGCEGLMVKLLDHKVSAYTASRRTGAWIKLKKDYVAGVALSDSLDVVPIGAWHGTGRRAGWYSPYLFAVLDKRTGTFQSLCRCMTGFTDQEFTQYRQFFEQFIVEEKPSNYDTTETPDFWFDAESHGKVWECRGADLTLSKVHAAATGLVKAPVRSKHKDADDYDDEDGYGARGVSLRFPRFIREREDKSIWDCTTSDQIADMYNAQFAHLRNHQE
jgi:DNA ligase-1